MRRKSLFPLYTLREEKEPLRRQTSLSPVNLLVEG